MSRIRSYCRLPLRGKSPRVIEEKSRRLIITCLHVIAHAEDATPQIGKLLPTLPPPSLGELPPFGQSVDLVGPTLFADSHPEPTSRKECTGHTARSAPPALAFSAAKALLVLVAPYGSFPPETVGPRAAAGMVLSNGSWRSG